ncbi:type II toxin-antitoxin system HipA family toxin [Seleniivibrio woodruffii]|uniref:type II toxin-antitoxin system HipA family toxin n=1 Tax=Seleniivibrio woodruffii TaxID=1078050 RepID=UPI0026F04A3A|nr:type II toxin-antitoxin system HipA family toxin [Seleniivibrio woodruffii]
MKHLNVSIPGKNGLRLVGQLYEDYSFEYADNIQISCSMPLDAATDKETVYNFFTGLLPEEEQLKVIAQYHRLSPKDTFGLLSKLGGDCAGALYFSENDNNFLSESSYRQLTLDELETILNELPRKPFASDVRTRMSLAGAQPKLPVMYDGKDFYLPEDTAASTHIIKPVYDNKLEYLEENEHTCLTLAKSIGLNTVDSEIITIGDRKALLVKRYDRKPDNGKIIRLHQEDFTQCLGLPRDKKYHGEYKQIADIIKKHCKSPVLDILSIIKWTLFNYLIGNADAHLKNISLLYDDIESGNKVSLAPFYDIVCTDIYDFSVEMAISIGEQVNPGHLTKEDWIEYAKDLDVNFRLIQTVFKDITQKIDFNVVKDSEIKRQIQEKYNQRKKWIEETI